MLAFVLALLGAFFIAPAVAQVSPVSGDVARIIEEEATAKGLSAEAVRVIQVIAMIENSGRPGGCTGSYCGLFQLSDDEFRARGGRGSIFDARENTRIYVLKFIEDANLFRLLHGRPPTATEIYLQHQQGQEGLAAHLADPARLAWRSMCTTSEGKEKGAGWCRLAIWGNVPSDVRSRYGSVDFITSGQFVELWRQRVEGLRPSTPIPVTSSTKLFPVIRECAIPAFGLRAFQTITGKPRP